MKFVIEHWDFFLGFVCIVGYYIFLWTKRHDNSFWKEFNSTDYNM